MFTDSDKVLRKKVFSIAKISKYDGYQIGLVSMVYNFFAKSSSTTYKGIGINSDVVPENQQLQNAINRKFEKQRVYSSFKDNAYDANLAGMELISKFNKVFHFFLCVIDFYCKYKWAVPLNDKKRITVTKAFQKKLDESNCKPNK